MGIEEISTLVTEQNLLACLFKNPKLIYEIDLSENDFSNKKGKSHNKAIFRVLKIIAKQKDMKENSNFDMVTIVDKINKFSALKLDIKDAFREESFKEGLTKYIDTLKNMRIDPDNIDIHIKELNKINIINKINRVNEKLGKKLMNNYHEYNLEDILNELESVALTISNKYSNKKDAPEKIGEGMMEEYMNREVSENGFVGFPSPYKNLDKFTGGILRKGSVTDFNARTNVGKSIILKNIVKKVGYDLEQPIYWGANEQQKHEQRDRLIAEITGINTDIIETGAYNKKGNEHLKKQIENAIVKLQKKPIYIDKIEGYKAEDLVRKAKYFKAKYNIVGFVWDHVKRSTAFSDSDKNLRHWLGDIINNMKTKIADPLGIFVVTATQAKTYEDLFARESQDIEDQCTAFIPIKRLTNKEKKEMGIMVGDYLFVIKKNRYGKTHNPNGREGILMTLDEDKLLFKEVIN
ncbi:MAG: DnaB-like helicase C-terminal domain-containing protein [Candidatus Woesearchaeota archaeon]